MDIGGTLTKLVYFERKSIEDIRKEEQSKKVIREGLRRQNSFTHLDAPDHKEALKQFYDTMSDTHIYGKTGIREDSLSFYSTILGGRLHFLRFETRQMETAMQNLSKSGVTDNIKSLGCTGGGAHKYEKVFNDMLDIKVHKMDELLCLVRGMQFVLNYSEGECYTFRYDADSYVKIGDDLWKRDAKDYVRKVQIAKSPSTTQYPYMIVNIGSGVSILKVTSASHFERVSGTSIGGGTYWGLCRLLTKCKTFEEVLDLAETGDASEVDMLVKDIYGGGYDAMNLKGSMVASSFGKLVMKDSINPDASSEGGIKPEDLAIALLMMITNNIGQVSYLNAQLHSCNRIYFIGNFLRHNSISCRRLAYAINFWSKGTMEALFLEHEGYFGALGTFLQGAFGSNIDLILNNELTNNTEEGAALTFASDGNSNNNNSDNHSKSLARVKSMDIPSIIENALANQVNLEQQQKKYSDGSNAASVSASLRSRTRSLDV